jgi:hypothetical protein
MAVPAYYQQVVDSRTGQVYLIPHGESSGGGIKLIVTAISFLTAIISAVPAVSIFLQHANSVKVERPAVIEGRHSAEPPRDTPTDPCAGSFEAWKEVSTVNTLSAYQRYLSRYPGCSFAVFARGNIATIRQNEQNQIDAERAKAQSELEQRQAQAEADRQRIAQDTARQDEAAAARLQKQQQELLRGHQSAASSAWLGLDAQSLTPADAQYLGLAEAIGALVYSVDPDGPADLAGIETGDLIWAMNGRVVTSADELAGQVRSLPPGSFITLAIIRGECDLIATVSLGQLTLRND